MTPLYAVAWPIVWLISKVFFFLGVKGKKNTVRVREGGKSPATLARQRLTRGK